MSGDPRAPGPPVIFREEALRSLSESDDGNGPAPAVRLPTGLLRGLWFAAAGLGLMLLVIAVRIAQLPR